MKALIRSVIFLAMTSPVENFLLQGPPSRTVAYSSQLYVKGKNNKKKGFAKQTASPAPVPRPAVSADSPQLIRKDDDDNSLLKSVNVVGSDAIPVQQDSSNDVDDGLTPKERVRITLEQYGIKPLEDEQKLAKQLEARKERSRKREKWQRKVEAKQEVDLMSTLPAPVLQGIDLFLKTGAVVCGTLFIIAGLFITVEAWSKASGQPLPESLDSFIVTTIEPNFTPGLLVLLSFSIGLGLFSAAQLGSAGATYKEDK